MSIPFTIISSLPVLLLLGVALGVTGGLLGIGGGLIAIPILAHVYGMEQQLAQGTALVMIAPNVLIGFIRYRQKNAIALRPLATMVACSMLATFLAARSASALDPRLLQIGFAVFLICLAGYFAWSPARAGHAPSASGPAARVPPSVMPLLGIASGVMSGLFTVGGGLVVVPALVTLFGIAQTRAQGMALALVVPGALIALCTYAGAGHVSWSIGLPLALGGMVSVSWGVALAHRFSAARLRRLFCAVLLGTAVMMLF